MAAGPQQPGYQAIPLRLLHMTDDPSRLLLVASNRGPVSYSRGDDGSLTARRGGGGMISGLTSGLAAAAADGGVLWLCTALSDADREAARLGARADAHGEPAVRMLEIPPAEFDAAYNGIANSILWFVHHRSEEHTSELQSRVDLV